MKRIILACLFAIAPAVASAIPVDYDVAYTATAGPSGVGSLTWDASAKSMTGLAWDFGSGRVGGVVDSSLAQTLGGGTFGAMAWEMITGEDVYPSLLISVQFNGFPPLTAGTTFPSGAIPGIQFLAGGNYLFRDISNNQTQSQGTVSVRARADTPTPVPEPTSLALLALGLAVALVSCTTRRAAAPVRA